MFSILCFVFSKSAMGKKGEGLDSGGEDSYDHTSVYTEGNGHMESHQS